MMAVTQDIETSHESHRTGPAATLLTLQAVLHIQNNETPNCSYFSICTSSNSRMKLFNTDERSVLYTRLERFTLLSTLTFQIGRASKGMATAIVVSKATMVSKVVFQ